MNLREIATGGDPRKALATKFFQSKQAEAFLSIVAHRERRIMEAVADLQEAVNDDDIERLEGLPSVDDRVEQIRSMALAMIDDSLPAWYVEEAIDIDNAEEAAQYADLTDEEWQTTKETWADRYREQGVEGGIDELATAHVRTRFDVDDLETFREAVVDWPSERQQAVLEEALAGGLEMAEQGIHDVTDAVDSEDR